MTETIYQHYFVKAWLKSIDKPVTFQLAEAAWGRFKRAFTDKREGFLIFATIDGRTLALNLAHIQMAKFFTKSSSTEAEINMDSSPEITVYFLDRDPESFLVEDPTDLAQAFTVIKPAKNKELLSFTEQEGGRVKFFTTDLVLLDTSTQFVEEGFLKIYQAKQATKPTRSL